MAQADNEANRTYLEKVKAAGAWIDNTFLKEVISNIAKEKVEVSEFNVKPAVGSKDNNFCILYSIAVKYVRIGSVKEEEICFIVKEKPTDEAMLKMIKTLGIFAKERYMYNKCLPKLNIYQKQYLSEEIPTIAPKAFECSRKNTIVMEDLLQEGYKICVNKRRQLNFQHSAATLKTLARLHALSVKVQVRSPEIIKKVSKEYYRARVGKILSQDLIDGFNLVADAHEKAGNEHFAKILREMTKYLWRKLVRLVEPSGKFNVLNHGDLWTNNILFKYNEDGSGLNAKFVDFQQSRYCSPALDLLHFFYSSIQPDVLKNKMSELLLLYHDTLVESLKTIAVKFDYSYDDLLKDMQRKAGYALISIVQVLPLSLADPSDRLIDQSSNTLHPGKGNILKCTYDNPTYVKISREYLFHLESMGYLSNAISQLQPLVDKLDSKSISKSLESGKKRRKSTKIKQSSSINIK